MAHQGNGGETPGSTTKIMWVFVPPIRSQRYFSFKSERAKGLMGRRRILLLCSESVGAFSSLQVFTLTVECFECFAGVGELVLMSTSSFGVLTF
jgi:hypothetical protein